MIQRIDVVDDVKILQTASYLPPRVVDNDDLTRLMDTSDQWIRQRTGILRRHISLGENTADLATKVAQKLLQESGISPAEVGLIIVATMSPEAYTPATAALVQGRIRADRALAFDLSAACAGFVYGVNVAHRLLQADDHCRFALVIGAEVLSKLIDWHDRRTAVLFGDGAGGVLMENSATSQPTWLGKNLRTFGQFGGAIVAGQTQVADSFPGRPTALSTFEMDGRSVYKFATHEVPRSIKLAAADAGIGLATIDHFLLHQANARIIKQVARRLGQPLAKFPMNIGSVGNTAAASEPLLLDECIRAGIVKRGDVIALSGFGGGLTTGTIILKY